MVTIKSHDLLQPADDLASLLRYVPVSDQDKIAVVQRLREPHRQYHNLDHVLEMWRWHNQYNRSKFDEIDEQIIASFCLYHDAVYDPQALEDANEQASADLWLHDSKSIASQPIRAAVDEIIYATGDHFEARGGMDDSCLCWCLDLDLLRLGSEQFTEHGRHIREEYAHLSDLQWLKGSSAFRTKAMAQSRIFVFDDFFEAEARARRNLATALVADWQALGYLT